MPALVEVLAALVKTAVVCGSTGRESAADRISESVPRFQVTYLGELEQDAKKINSRKGSDVFIFWLVMVWPSGLKVSPPIPRSGPRVSAPSSSAGGPGPLILTLSARAV